MAPRAEAKMGVEHPVRWTEERNNRRASSHPVRHRETRPAQCSDWTPHSKRLTRLLSWCSGVQMRTLIGSWIVWMESLWARNRSSRCAHLVTCCRHPGTGCAQRAPGLHNVAGHSSEGWSWCCLRWRTESSSWYWMHCGSWGIRSDAFRLLGLHRGRTLAGTDSICWPCSPCM